MIPLQKLEDLLKALCKHGLKISPKKCQLFKTELQYMGNTIFINDKYCVMQCWTSFRSILGVLALNFCFTSSLHNICSSSGSLFSTHLGSIIFIAHYISIFITDQINYIYIFLFTTQLHNNLELQGSTYWCLV